MNHGNLPVEVNTGRWNRKILNVYWLVVVFSFLIECANLMMTKRDPLEFILYFILLPTLLLIAVVGLTEALRKINGKYLDYGIIIAGTLMASVLVAVHSTIEVIFAALFLPLMTSTVYFQKSKIYFAAGFTVTAYLITCWVIPTIQFSLMTHFTMIGMTLTAMLICIGIMRRGSEIHEHLRKTMEAKQELMVKSTLMEKRVKLDGLTGLHNHMSFHEYLDNLIIQCEEQQLKLSLAVFDIDNFKKINDTWGHRTGDLILERISSMIQTGVGPDDFVARYGGEEFCVIFMDQTPEAAFQLVDKIREDIARLDHLELDGHHVTISAGLNHYRKGMGKEQLFGGADSFLYVAKRAGKNRVVEFEEGKRQQA